MCAQWNVPQQLNISVNLVESECQMVRPHASVTASKSHLGKMACCSHQRNAKHKHSNKRWAEGFSVWNTDQGYVVPETGRAEIEFYC